MKEVDIINGHATAAAFLLPGLFRSKIWCLGYFVIFCVYFRLYLQKMKKIIMKKKVFVDFDFDARRRVWLRDAPSKGLPVVTLPLCAHIAHYS